MTSHAFSQLVGLHVPCHMVGGCGPEAAAESTVAGFLKSCLGLGSAGFLDAGSALGTDFFLAAARVKSSSESTALRLCPPTLPVPAAGSVLTDVDEADVPVFVGPV